MRVSVKKIRALNPCKSRLDNFLEHYPSFKGNMREFFALDKITHHDKLWVFLRLIDASRIPLVAADFAEAVLHIYESRYPGDTRPREAIEAARSGDKERARKAVDAAVDAAAYYAAANAAAYYAAVSVKYAAYAAYATCAAYVAYAARHAVFLAANAADSAGMEKQQLTICMKHLIKQEKEKRQGK